MIVTAQQVAIKNGMAIMNRIAKANPTLVDPFNASLHVGHANTLAGEHNSAAIAATQTKNRLRIVMNGLCIK